MGTFIQLHFLTAYPPANLNRDDLGRPKTAIFGGTQRLRVSSQSLKRAWRTSGPFRDALADYMGQRTHMIAQRVATELGGDEKAKAVAKKVAEQFAKVDEKKLAKGVISTGQIVHIAKAELDRIDAFIAKAKTAEPGDADYQELLGDGKGSVDIALFGRMLAEHSSRSVEAACQVAHALSIHKVAVEDDFFSAVDDLNTGEEDRGAGHIGTTEFAAGVLYHYVCIDVGLLTKNLNGDATLAKLAIAALIEACAKVAPTGKQNSFGSRAHASYLLAERGGQQPRSLCAAYLRPVEGSDQMNAGIDALTKARQGMDAVYGPCSDASAAFNCLTGEGSLASVVAFCEEAVS